MEETLFQPQGMGDGYIGTSIARRRIENYLKV